MSTIQEQTTDIHQQIRDFVERKYPSYRVSVVRNNSNTLYAQEITSIIEFYVEAVNDSKDLHCYLAVKNGVISVISSGEEKNKHLD